MKKFALLAAVAAVVVALVAGVAVATQVKYKMETVKKGAQNEVYVVFYTDDKSCASFKFNIITEGHGSFSGDILQLTPLTAKYKVYTYPVGKKDPAPKVTVSITNVGPCQYKLTP